MNKKIGIIGLGSMGGAIYQALSKIMDAAQLYPCDSDIVKIQALNPKNASTDSNEIAASADILILAVKPQSFEQLTRNLKGDLQEKIILSIMAGVSLSKLMKGTKSKKVVRAMPNLPVQVKKGFIGWISTPEVSTEEKNIIREILKTMGKEVELPNENAIDAITALSGSGPAYFFYLCEIITKKAEILGFEKETARIIAEQTFIGSARLLENNGKNAGEWRNSVTSKGGTTEAALKIFMESNLEQIIFSGIEAAKKKSVELNND